MKTEPIRRTLGRVRIILLMLLKEKTKNDKIVIAGARENNLKNVNLTIPRDTLVVFTGLSGSG